MYRASPMNGDGLYALKSSLAGLFEGENGANRDDLPQVHLKWWLIIRRLVLVSGSEMHRPWPLKGWQETLS